MISLVEIVIQPSLTSVSSSAIAELRSSGEFSDMDLQTDEDEHSIEMHLPYVRKVFEGFVIHCDTSFSFHIPVNHSTSEN